MNEATPLNWRWFNCSRGKVGVVKVHTDQGKIEYRIAPVDGFMEKMDILQVVAWGDEFPEAAGVALFGEVQ